MKDLSRKFWKKGRPIGAGGRMFEVHSEFSHPRER